MSIQKRVYPSGAAKRRAKQDAAQRTADASPLSIDLEKQERADYSSAGLPPSEVVGRMVWVQGLMAKAIYWTAVHAGTPELQSTRRTILEGGAKLGITAVKALYEERLKKLESKVYGKRRQKGKADASEDGLEELPSD